MDDDMLPDTERANTCAGCGEVRPTRRVESASFCLECRLLLSDGGILTSWGMDDFKRRLTRTVKHILSDAPALDGSLPMTRTLRRQLAAIRPHGWPESAWKSWPKGLAQPRRSTLERLADAGYLRRWSPPNKLIRYTLTVHGEAEADAELERQRKADA